MECFVLFWWIGCVVAGAEDSWGKTVSTVAISTDGRKIVSGGKILRIWSTETGEVPDSVLIACLWMSQNRRVSEIVYCVCNTHHTLLTSVSLLWVVYSFCWGRQYKCSRDTWTISPQSPYQPTVARLCRAVWTSVCAAGAQELTRSLPTWSTGLIELILGSW